MTKLPRHPCPVCGRSIAPTASSINAAWGEGKLVRYVYLRTHHDPEGHPCPGTHALVDPPTQPHPSPSPPPKSSGEEQR